MYNGKDPFFWDGELVETNNFTKLINSAIYKSKKLIQARTNFSSIETRWLELLYAKINPNQRRLMDYYPITFKEYSLAYKIPLKIVNNYAYKVLLNKNKFKKIEIPLRSWDPVNYKFINFIDDIIYEGYYLNFYINHQDMSLHLLKKYNPIKKID